MSVAGTGGRQFRRRVDGVLLLDKPVGLSSNAALQRVKRLYAAAKAGHTGTLDPLASGLLPICLGEATKFAQFLLDAGKAYRATVRFGTETTTQDAEGDVCAMAPVDFTRADLEAALASFVGPLDQVPPRHAALKHQGRKYYEYARRGVEIERKPRPVEIHALRLVAWDPPDATVEVICGKGTYVRVLAQDLGRALGSAAHLAALRRTATGGFDLANAIPLTDLEALDRASRDARLLAPDAPLAGVGRLDLDAGAAVALQNGRRPETAATAGRYRAYVRGGGFVGLVEVDAGTLKAVRLVRFDAAFPVETGALPAAANAG